MYQAYLTLLTSALAKVEAWRSSFGIVSAKDDEQRMQHILDELAQRLTGNYPFHHPSYAGQMLKPPHPLAWMAYALTATINPNNHALDGGPPSSEMEKEVVEGIASMIGYSKPYLGHLTSSGTTANLEALWVARNHHPEKAIAASASAHYTHERMSEVIGAKFLKIPMTAQGTFDVQAFEEQASQIGTLVVTMGTTGLGNVEPLHQIVPIARKYGIRIHVDAAYGGYFKLLEDEGRLDAAPWKLMHEADSVVIDPHKHGLQPYGCGCVVFKDATVGRFYVHDSPYTYFSSDELHLGEISLECSRAGAAAAALWATMQYFPLEKKGTFMHRLGASLEAARLFSEHIIRQGHFTCYQQPELDIVGYFPVADSTSRISALSQAIFSRGMQLPPDRGFHLSLYKVSSEHFGLRFPHLITDSNQVVLLRSVFMKPEQKAFVPELVKRLEDAYQQLSS